MKILKLCEICGSNIKVSYYEKFNVTVCNKHRLQLYTKGKIKLDQIPLKEQPCIICNKIFKSMNSKNGISYCARHYMQLRLYNKILPDTNNIEIDNDTAIIILWNNRVEQKEMGRAIIDLEDVNKIKDYYWILSSEKYAYNSLNKIFLHNLILNIDTSNVTRIVPDHIDRNRLNCRKANLRIVSRTVNCINKGIQSNNTSGYPGVSYIKKVKKYRVYIKLNGKQIHLGNYEYLNNAIEARQNGELKYFGEIVNREYDINTVYKKDINK